MRAEDRYEYDGYGAVAPVYDRLNAEIDYTAWAAFAERCMEKFCRERPALVLDLACGTGRMTIAMAERGYDMIGVDGSADMLAVAYDRAAAAGRQSFLFQYEIVGEFSSPPPHGKGLRRTVAFGWAVESALVVKFGWAFETERVDEPKCAAEPERTCEAKRVAGLPPAFESLRDLRILCLHVRYAVHMFCEVISKICRDE